MAPEEPKAPATSPPGMPAPERGDGLAALEDLGFADRVAWLDLALHGGVPLPMVVPDESPEEPILRLERSLSNPARRDIATACHTLIRRFLAHPTDTDDFVAALLRLAKGLGMAEVASDLHGLAQDASRFALLPPAQQKVVVSTLLDLRSPLPPQFWRAVAERDPARFGIVALSQLLRDDLEAAGAVIALLPDEPRTADEVYVVLGQASQMLEDGEKQRLVDAVQAASVAPAIRSAVGEWAEETVPSPRRSAPWRLEKLASGLKAFYARGNKSYIPAPRSAMLGAPPYARAPGT